MTRALTRAFQSLCQMADRTELSDRQLLERFVSERNEQAFTAIVHRHQRMVYGACRRLLEHVQDAEDVFQAVFLVLAKKAASVSWQESVSGWLFQTAYRLAQKTKAKAHRRRTQCTHMDTFAPACQSDEMVFEALRPILYEELSRLPDKQRSVVVLCYLEGKSRKRAAAQLGWSENAVRFQLEKGRSRLRARLARRGLPLTGAVLTALLADRAGAAVPTALTEATIQAALLPTAEAAVQGLISNSCSLLTQGALPTVWTNKIIVLGMVALLCLGTA